MRRTVLAALAGLLLAVPVFGVAAAASARQADEPDTSNFTFESYDADFYLSTDENGRSQLTTVETFVAVFPDTDQNHGMRRAIPLDYAGHPTDVSVTSVTDETGAARAFETDTDDGFLLVTSREDGFVHGAQTYVFTYTQHNVTRFFADTGVDELYWDTTGTGWDQPFGTVTARFHIPSALLQKLGGDPACYVGAEGSTRTCEVTRDDTADGAVFTTSVDSLLPRENVTMAFGFEEGTFVPRDDSYFGTPLSFVQIIAGIGSLLAAGWAFVLRRTRLADGRGRPTIIAEYSPPKGIDPLIAAVILGKTPKATAAQLMDLAVRGKIRIIDQPRTGFLASGSDYLLELIDPTGLSTSQQALAEALFGPQLVEGSQYLMTKNDTALATSVQSIVASAPKQATQMGLRKQGTARFTALPIIVAVACAGAAAVAGIIMLSNSVGGGAPAMIFIPAILVVILVVALVARAPLTEAGAELRDHLKGLELYIRLAEADRLKMLQSPTGALREAAGEGDDRQVIDVYEKLLPYAVLFGLEKEWAAELGKYYADAQPDWYSGSSAFNAGVFAASIGSMSSAVSTSYSGSASSSSSGGSGGGGSSGGGGGGGGGGGV